MIRVRLALLWLASGASNPTWLHTEVQKAFLEKNPWNATFFTADGAVLIHLAPIPSTSEA